MQLTRKTRITPTTILDKIDPGELFEFVNDTDECPNGIFMVLVPYINNAPGSKGVKKVIAPSGYIPFVNVVSGAVSYEPEASPIRTIKATLTIEN